MKLNKTKLQSDDMFINFPDRCQMVSSISTRKGYHSTNGKINDEDLMIKNNNDCPVSSHSACVSIF